MRVPGRGWEGAHGLGRRSTHKGAPCIIKHPPSAPGLVLVHRVTLAGGAWPRGTTQLWNARRSWGRGQAEADAAALASVQCGFQATHQHPRL